MPYFQPRFVRGCSPDEFLAVRYLSEGNELLGLLDQSAAQLRALRSCPTDLLSNSSPWTAAKTT